MRIDKLLWFLRFVGSRGLAQDLVLHGHIRLNGKRVERCAQGVSQGSVLVLPLGSAVRVVRITTLPNRRGPASEAQACYEVLDEVPAYPLAGAEYRTATKGDLQP